MPPTPTRQDGATATGRLVGGADDAGAAGHLDELAPGIPNGRAADRFGTTRAAPATTLEPLTDFPFREQLPPELRPALQELVRRTGNGGDVITRLAGWKLGGWPTWHLTHPMVFRCRTCETDMTLLFTVASDDETGVIVGRWGDLRIFACPADRRHPFQVDLH
ncbi:hypothetical protein OH809_40335 [Streptomyces sp. NBC_00873]|uniref:hypothetical protein n=1 Tax=unclassified Streptomyces TaxID=2593676 RepID=UPI00386E5A57|nr:hypothetical protein OH809_40335 [Streptomyces sp. NBC_00873]WTA41816.1 hypothetical protein OH821_03365 [Streptomyces sp. NBC_00842]